MKVLMTTVALALAAFGVSAQAAAHAASAPMARMAPTAQQSKMATCNKDAADKKGTERKAFMKTCLSDKIGRAHV